MPVPEINDLNVFEAAESYVDYLFNQVTFDLDLLSESQKREEDRGSFFLNLWLQNFAGDKRTKHKEAVSEDVLSKIQNDIRATLERKQKKSLSLGAGDLVVAGHNSVETDDIPKKMKAFSAFDALCQIAKAMFNHTHYDGFSQILLNRERSLADLANSLLLVMGQWILEDTAHKEELNKAKKIVSTSDVPNEMKDVSNRNNGKTAQGISGCADHVLSEKEVNDILQTFYAQKNTQDVNTKTSLSSGSWKLVYHQASASSTRERLEAEIRALQSENERLKNAFGNISLPESKKKLDGADTANAVTVALQNVLTDKNKAVASELSFVLHDPVILAELNKVTVTMAEFLAEQKVRELQMHIREIEQLLEELQVHKGDIAKQLEILIHENDALRQRFILVDNILDSLKMTQKQSRKCYEEKIAQLYDRETSALKMLGFVIKSSTYQWLSMISSLKDLESFSTNETGIPLKIFMKHKKLVFVLLLDWLKNAHRAPLEDSTKLILNDLDVILKEKEKFREENDVVKQDETNSEFDATNNLSEALSNRIDSLLSELNDRHRSDRFIRCTIKYFVNCVKKLIDGTYEEESNNSADTIVKRFPPQSITEPDSAYEYAWTEECDVLLEVLEQLKGIISKNVEGASKNMLMRCLRTFNSPLASEMTN